VNGEQTASIHLDDVANGESSAPTLDPSLGLAIALRYENLPLPDRAKAALSRLDYAISGHAGGWQAGGGAVSYRPSPPSQFDLNSGLAPSCRCKLQSHSPYFDAIARRPRGITTTGADTIDHDPEPTAGTMAHQNEGVNPLRPYYIPPSIGEPVDAPLPTPGPRAFTDANTTGKYTSKARDIFSDIDYKNYIADPSPSAVKTVKDFLDELLWKYTSVLLAQPFEVAKTLMQVRVQDDLGGLEATAAAAAEAAKQRPENQMSSSYGGEVCKGLVGRT